MGVGSARWGGGGVDEVQGAKLKTQRREPPQKIFVYSKIIFGAKQAKRITSPGGGGGGCPCSCYSYIYLLGAKLSLQITLSVSMYVFSSLSAIRSSDHLTKFYRIRMIFLLFQFSFNVFSYFSAVVYSICRAKSIYEIRISRIMPQIIITKNRRKKMVERGAATTKTIIVDQIKVKKTSQAFFSPKVRD